jgi:diguanylate cyclase (GGDEF)-like protein
MNVSKSLTTSSKICFKKRRQSKGAHNMKKEKMLARRDDGASSPWDDKHDPGTGDGQPPFEARGGQPPFGARSGQPPIGTGGGQPPFILAVDSDEGFLQKMQQSFAAQGWMTVATCDPAHAVQTYFEMKPDLVILDAIAAEGAGAEPLNLKAIREHAEAALVPLIVTGGGPHLQELRQRSFASGANDFLEKPLDEDELIVRVGRQLDLRRRVDEIALLDKLSGVYNRKYFAIEMSRQINDLRRTREPFTLVIMDLDRIREINEQFGYAEGDRWIQRLGHFVKKRIRNSDVAARLQADRFILVLPKTYAENALTLVRRLQNEFAEILVQSDSGAVARTFSAGLLEVIDGDWDEDTCLRMAEAALLDAKSEGGGASRIFRFQDANEGGWKRHLHLAIVEDDDLIRNLLEKQLRDMGGPELVLDIRSYSDGDYFFADEWHKRRGQFLIILDRNMPRMNGMEVVQRLRSNYDRTRYQVLMLSVVNSEESISRAIEAGVDDYMTKPFSLVELESRILRLVKGKKR